MKRFHQTRIAIAACSISLFAMISCAVAIAHDNAAALQAKKGAAQKNADVERELIRLEEQYNELFLKHEFAKIVENWADDVVFINLEGKIQDKAAALKEMQESKDRFDTLKNTEFKVRVKDDVAVITYLVTVTGTISGQARYTDILEKRNGKWILVHSQGTIVQGAVTTPPKQ